ncbi:substrate-binding domain-containing protein [uncultured Amaricoccus sp.]|nr:substrate-binding domain-containing protein [uncultured Amaricoccus sp.]
MTTLRDVARVTGYSMTTVSRALRGFEDVAAGTRQRIETVARALDYRPHQIARKLVTGRSGMVGLILDAPPKPFEAGHFLEFVTGLSMAFSARDLDFVLHVGDESNALATHERLINRGALDGFVVTLPVIGDPRVDLLLKRNAAFVMHGHEFGDDRYAYFDTDNHAVSGKAVEVLAGAGHRRIALIAGPPEWPSVGDRVRGFRQAMEARGLPVDTGLILHGDTSEAHGAAALSALLALGTDRPSALVCCNALVAAGVCRAAREAGLSIPKDLSVVAHDDVLPQVQTDALDPPLTVTRLALRDACEPLANLLLRRIAGEPVADLQVTREPELILRASVTRPSNP